MKTTRSSVHSNHTHSPARGRTIGIGRRSFAPGNILPLLCLAAVLLAVGAQPARASDPVGCYAFVDKVVLEPNDTSPDRIQVWGGFALAKDGGDNYAPAKRGYMYFKLKMDKETLCRNEWADLKSVAGTGKIVALGVRYGNNGTVRPPEAKAENPDVYPLGFGMRKISMKDYKPINELNALIAAKAPGKQTK
jgi:hypothetical protein